MVVCCLLFLVTLKKTTHTFPLTFQTKERLANEDLMQRIQDMEQSTARVSIGIVAILKLIL